MSKTTLTEMPSRPTLLRGSSPKLTFREAVAATIRGECGGHSWDTATLAEILHISIQRARDLRAGRRRPLTLDELELFCTAASLTPVEFFDKVAGRRNNERVFADTTVSNLVIIAAKMGTTPSRLLEQQGWVNLPADQVARWRGGCAPDAIGEAS